MTATTTFLVVTPPNGVAEGLKHFEETSGVVKGRLSLPFVDSRRMVYEVVGSFGGRYAFHGTVWQSGNKTYVVDAQSGDLLYVALTGNEVVRPVPSKEALKCVLHS